jgi:site-specific DNA-methyltransferase (adenine-specific)
MLNQFLLGDCFDVMPHIPAGSVDLILADLPYGVTNCKWDSVLPLDNLWSEYKRVLKPAGAVVLTATQPFTSALLMSNPAWYRHVWVWEKDQPSNFLNAKKAPLNYHEDILVFCRKGTLYNPQMVFVGKESHKPKLSKHKSSVYNTDFDITFTPSKYRYPKTIIKFNKTKHNQKDGGLHPTQKPVPLFEYLIKTYSNEGEVVLDNTAGVATTAIAAINTGRQYIAIEKELKYWQLGTERIATHLESRQLKMDLAS